MLALPRGNIKAASWSETHLKYNSSDQKKGVQLIAKAGPFQRKFWSTGDHDIAYGNCLSSSIESEICTERYTK